MIDSNPEFVCSHCGESHKGHPTDYGFTLPDVVWAIPEEERKRQAKWTSDLCQFGERYFIRCLLAVPFAEGEGHFGWGLWVEVDWPTFEHYLSIYDRDATSEAPSAARIANQPAGYDPVLGAHVTIQFGPATERPRVIFRPTVNTSLHASNPME